MNGVTTANRDRLAALGGRTVGSAAQWKASGISRKKLEALAASGDLVRVRRGFYATREVLAKATDDPSLAHTLKAAAVRAMSARDGAASHHSAARMHGMELLYPPEEDVVTITVPPGRQAGRHGAAGVVLHAAMLPEGHVTRLYGLPVTTAARTVADIARTSTFMQGVVVADSALRKKLTLKPQIQAVLEDCQRWPGIDLARRVVEFADWAPESVLESCARVVFRQYGLPSPLLQAPLLGRDGKFAARVDFCWPEYGTVAEADGMAKYKAQASLDDKYHRDTRIQDVGWEVVHFSWKELFSDPAVIIGRVRAAFERGLEPSARKRREGVPQPAAATSRRDAGAGS